MAFSIPRAAIAAAAKVPAEQTIFVSYSLMVVLTTRQMAGRIGGLPDFYAAPER